MNKMNQSESVAEQYKNTANLSARINLHQRYSVNPYGYHNWLFDQYAFTPGEQVLELGCGTGETWKGKILPGGVHLTLTDLSPGMVEAARTALTPEDITADAHTLSAPALPAVFETADIQNIPWPDASYDVVIANSMLYHVPDISRALEEVRRVLRPSGRFYAATMGIKDGMYAWLRAALKEYGPGIDAYSQSGVSFTLENGIGILDKVFTNVELHRYEDSLAVTDVNDLVAWLSSSIAMLGIEEEKLNGLPDFFEQKKDAQGVLRIPKSVGIFIAG